MNHARNRTVLISGASIAGPTLAYWLSRYGFQVTVVEKAHALRGGGYAIDIRGTARGVVDRMGLLPRLREAHVDTRTLTFLDPDGSLAGALSPETLMGSEPGEDLEVRRGDLASALYDTIGGDVEFLFGDSLATLKDHEDRVEVTFESGVSRTFDLVIGADGLHSRTRRLSFGPEEPYHHYLGRVFAGFTLPNTLGLAHEGVVWSVPGRTAAVLAYEADVLQGILAFSREEPPLTAFRDPEAQRELIRAEFTEQVAHIPELVDAMLAADDLFFDVVSQIHLPTWSRGRVALAGDAAHATSFLSGQGSSVALVGAYVLAGELAQHADHADAFAAYERKVRGFAEQNQALASSGSTMVAPTTQAEIDQRNAALRDPSLLPADVHHAANTGLTLPDYSDLER